MNSRPRVIVPMVVLAAVVIGLVFLYPRAFAFVELAARELRYLWWLVLLLALAVWLIWGYRRRPK